MMKNKRKIKYVYYNFGVWKKLDFIDLMRVNFGNAIPYRFIDQTVL